MTEKFKSKYINAVFWQGALDRSIAAFAQAALAFFTAGVTGLFEINFVDLLSVSLLAALASILTSIASPERIVNAEKETEKVLTGEIKKIVEEKKKADIEIQAKNKIIKGDNPMYNPFKKGE